VCEEQHHADDQYGRGHLRFRLFEWGGLYAAIFTARLHDFVHPAGSLASSAEPDIKP
jgi:hypothetical protein